MIGRSLQKYKRNGSLWKQTWCQLRICYSQQYNQQCIGTHQPKNAHHPPAGMQVLLITVLDMVYQRYQCKAAGFSCKSKGKSNGLSRITLQTSKKNTRRQSEKMGPDCTGDYRYVSRKKEVEMHKNSKTRRRTNRRLQNNWIKILTWTRE